MKKFVLQWHIIHKCNLRCKHCYQEDYTHELTKEELVKIFYDFKAFLEKNNFKGHINFTGGEPILSDNLFDLLDLCEENKISFGILTNGTLIDKEIVSKLSKYKCLSFVQVSIDGTKEVHDDIRGSGNFEKSFNALKLLRKNRIQTMVAFTISKANYKSLPDVIKIMRKNKIDRFWCDRLVPFGSNTEEIISTNEYMEVVKILTEESHKRGLFNKTTIHTNRAMQWCAGGTEFYKCSAGDTLLTILADGTLLPCRRLPLELGNVLKNSIDEIYSNSEIVKELKSNVLPEECQKCLQKRKCFGGAKCLSYAVKGNYHVKDINCPICS